MATKTRTRPKLNSPLHMYMRQLSVGVFVDSLNVFKKRIFANLLFWLALFAGECVIRSPSPLRLIIMLVFSLQRQWRFPSSLKTSRFQCQAMRQLFHLKPVTPYFAPPTTPMPIKWRLNLFSTSNHSNRELIPSGHGMKRNQVPQLLLLDHSSYSLSRRKSIWTLILVMPAVISCHLQYPLFILCINI